MLCRYLALAQLTDFALIDWTHDEKVALWLLLQTQMLILQVKGFFYGRYVRIPSSPGSSRR